MNNKVDWAYCHLDNIKITENATDNQLCYVYFSSNALYTDEGTFTEKILNNDRYEWEHIRPFVIPRMEIFVRDVYRSWYVNGINKDINSLEEICNYLRLITAHYSVRCIGASSGGFISSYVAKCLGCECVSFAGQFSLLKHFDHTEKNPFIKQFLAEHGKESLEIYKIISSNEESALKIYYIYPMFSQQDMIQYSTICDNEHIQTLYVKSDKHGVAIYPYALPNFLSLTSKQLDKYCGKKYSKLFLSTKVGGVRETIKYFGRKSLSKIRSRQTVVTA